MQIKKKTANFLYQCIAQQYIDLIENVEQYLAQSTTSLVESRNKVKIVNYQGQQFVIKSFRKPDLFMRMVYTYCRPSKARRSFLYAKHLLKCQFSTPTPIAYREDFKAHLLTKSYYISKYLAHDQLMFDCFQQCDQNLAANLELLKQFAAFTFKLHQQHIYHNDYTSRNILVKQDKQHYSFTLVDLNRLRFCKRTILGKAKNISSVWNNFTVLDIITTEYARLAKINPQRLCKLVHFWKKIGFFKGALKHYRNQFFAIIRNKIKKANFL